VCIENYRGIIEYTECLIRVQAKGKQIRLQGRHLQIEYYTNDEMKITGTICSLEFCK
jgi:sporulation protein YqfC